MEICLDTNSRKCKALKSLLSEEGSVARISAEKISEEMYFGWHVGNRQHELEDNSHGVCQQECKDALFFVPEHK